MQRGIFRFLAVVALGAVASVARADAVGYSRVIDLEAKGDTFVVRHHHDWSGKTRDARDKMMATDRDPFTAANTYASLTWLGRSGGVVRTVPSPALNWLGVTADSRYVIGLSAIKLDNPYQLVVYDREGNLLLKRHIGATVACLTPEQFRLLGARLAPAADLLEERIWRADGRVYVDYDALSPREHAGLWSALQPHDCRSPFSAAITESVTNAVNWYDAKDPAPAVLVEGGVPTGVRLRDPEGRLFTVPFRLEAP
jgi:hypothetical protein